MGFHDLQELFGGNVAWAAGLAGLMLALTALATKLLNPQRKDEIALWLMGAAEDSWHRTFCDLFDAVFGRNHLTWKCARRSALASLLSVVVIWFFMGKVGLIGARLDADLSLGWLLALALGVNLVADYLSLYETRWLIGQMHRVKTAPLQALLLLVDLVVSATIIWVAILLFVRSPIYSLFQERLHTGETASFAEILGVFSIFSVLFYSTFLTSLWTWAYIFSTWMIRLFGKLRLAHWLDVEHQPLTILGYVLAGVVFLGTMTASAPLHPDSEGLSSADRALCGVFGGRVCAKIAGLTKVEQIQLDLITRACADGVTEECLDRAGDEWEVTPQHAGQLWSAACDAGIVLGCLNLGMFNETGRAGSPDFGEAARLYSWSCDGRDARGCTALGSLYERGAGMSSDPVEAFRLYSKGCDDGDMNGCSMLASLYESGKGTKADPSKAARLYSKACDGGYAGGCNGLGYLYDNGFGVGKDMVKAAKLYAKACDGGFAIGCTNTGYMLQLGHGVETDNEDAARHYEMGCERGDPNGCANLGVLYELAVGVAADLEKAVQLYKQGCEKNAGRACTNLADLYERGHGVDQSLDTATKLYAKGCEDGDEKGCDALERLKAAQ